jgi:hypothetical protein
MCSLKKLEVIGLICRFDAIFAAQSCFEIIVYVNSVYKQRRKNQKIGKKKGGAFRSDTLRKAPPMYANCVTCYSSQLGALVTVLSATHAAHWMQNE